MVFIRNAINFEIDVNFFWFPFPEFLKTQNNHIPKSHWNNVEIFNIVYQIQMKHFNFIVETLTYVILYEEFIKTNFIWNIIHYLVILKWVTWGTQYISISICVFCVYLKWEIVFLIKVVVCSNAKFTSNTYEIHIFAHNKGENNEYFYS